MIVAKFKKQEGFIALFTIVIIGAVALIIVKSVAVIGLAEINMAWDTNRGDEALVIAEGCAEETLRRFQLDQNYSASGVSLSLGNGVCAINTAAQGDGRTITVLGNINSYYKNIEVEITISSSTISVDNWEEVSW